MSQPPDVFSSIRPKSEHELLEKVFCVNDWQTEITRNYISSASMFPTPRKGKRSQEVKSKENIEKPFTTNPFKSQGEFYSQTKSESREPERIVVRSLSRIGNTDNRKITELDEEDEHLRYSDTDSEESEKWKSSPASDIGGDSATGKETTKLGRKLDGETLFSKLPRWKRDLLREAPRGLFSNRKQVKVNIAMSKTKRIQELDRMVVEHVYDPKEVAKRECRRREYNKLQLYSTLLQLKDISTRTKFSENPNWQ